MNFEKVKKTEVLRTRSGHQYGILIIGRDVLPQMADRKLYIRVADYFASNHACFLLLCYKS